MKVYKFASGLVGWGDELPPWPCVEVIEAEDLPEQPEGRYTLDLVNGMPAWVALPLEPKPEPTPQEDADAMLVDHEYRLTLLELGV